MTAGSEIALVDPDSTRLPGATQAASAKRSTAPVTQAMKQRWREPVYSRLD